MPSLALACRLIAVSLASRRPFSPASLFSSGEQGVWYDPSDFSTMFQDAEGTKPVTAIGQPVGLMLDKSKGLVLGSELVTNGDFSQGTTGWTVPAGWSVTGGAAVATATSSSLYGGNFTSVNGRYYRVEFDVISYTSGTLYIAIGANFTGNPSLTGTAMAPGRKSVVVLAGANNTKGVEFYGGSISATIDNISVRELHGNHATQATTTSRPTLSARVNLLTESEFRNGLADATTRVGLISASALSGYSGAVAFSHDGATTSAAYKSVTGFSNTPVLFSVVVRMDDEAAPRVGLNAGPSNDFRMVVNGLIAVPSQQEIAPGVYRLTASATVTSDGSPNFGVVKYSVDSGKTFKVTAYDLRLATDAHLPYQRVNTATDYDTAGFPMYLRFDGVDDFLQTNSIDFTATDKMTVFAGVRKLSDAALYSVVAELSANWTQNNGAFALMAPFDGAGTYSSGAKGDAAAAGAHYATMSGATSPDSAVLTATHSISGDLSTIKRNGVSGTNGTADKGAGNYGNYPLYIGRRGGTTFPFNGRLYGLIVRGAATDATQLEQTEQWINSKMGGIY